MKTIAENKQRTFATPTPKFDPASIRAGVDRHAATTTAAIKKDIDRLEAEAAIYKDDWRRAELEVRAAGGDPAQSDRVQALRRDYQRREEEIVRRQAELNAIEHNRQVRLEEAPAAVARLGTGIQLLLRNLVTLQPQFDEVIAGRDEVRSLLDDTNASGAPVLVGLPNAGSLIGLINTLETIFGQDRNAYGGGSWLERLRREARDLGIEV